MSYLPQATLESMGFKRLGRDVKISDKASLYDVHEMELGDFSRIDDFCVISGRVVIGKFNHITPMCLVAGGIPGVFMQDFCTLAYGVKVFAQSDDYSGETLTNSLVSKKFKKEIFAPVYLEKHVIVGTSSIVMPGITVAEGCAIGAMSLVTRSTDPWGIYKGTPAKRYKDRTKNLLTLEKQFLKEYQQ